MATDNFFVA